MHLDVYVLHLMGNWTHNSRYFILFYFMFYHSIFHFARQKLFLFVLGALNRSNIPLTLMNMTCRIKKLSDVEKLNENSKKTFNFFSNNGIFENYYVWSKLWQTPTHPSNPLINSYTRCAISKIPIKWKWKWISNYQIHKL